jgi:putative thioredoxin
VALAGIAKCYLAGGDVERAKQALAMVPPEQQNHEAVAPVLAQLKLLDLAPVADNLSEIRARIEANPADLQARFDLASALAAGGQSEAAVDEFLEIIKRDRTWNDGAAKQQLLTLFEALGAADPAVKSGRRKLSTLLFS